MKTISKYLFVSLFAPSVPFHFLADDDIRGYSPSVVGVWPSPLSSRPQTMASLRGLSCVRSVGGSLRTLKTISTLCLLHCWTSLKKGKLVFSNADCLKRYFPYGICTFCSVITYLVFCSFRVSISTF